MNTTEINYITGVTGQIKFHLIHTPGNNGDHENCWILNDTVDGKIRVGVIDNIAELDFNENSEPDTASNLFWKADIVASCLYDMGKTVAEGMIIAHEKFINDPKDTTHVIAAAADIKVGEHNRILFEGSAVGTCEIWAATGRDQSLSFVSSGGTAPSIGSDTPIQQFCPKTFHGESTILIFATSTVNLTKASAESVTPSTLTQWAKKELEANPDPKHDFTLLILETI